MFLLYAAILLVVCVPIAALLRQVPRVAALDRGPALQPAADSPPLTSPSRMTFTLVAAAFAFGGIVYNLPSLMLPVLEGLGLGASAILIGMIFGPSQTAGRFFDMVFGGRVSAITAAVLAAAMVVVALAVLLLGWASAGIVFAVMFGAGAGSVPSSAAASCSQSTTVRTTPLGSAASGAFALSSQRCRRSVWRSSWNASAPELLSTPAASRPSCRSPALSCLQFSWRHPLSLNIRHERKTRCTRPSGSLRTCGRRLR